MDQTAVPQRRREQALPVLRPVLHGVLPAAPKGDHQRGVIVHRPGEAMTAPVADTPGPAAPPPPVEPAAQAARPPPASRCRCGTASGCCCCSSSSWLIIVWASMADNPLLPFSDAALIQLSDSQWLLWLAGLEVVRQIHFFVSERSPGYHRFWSEKVFGGFDRAIHRRFSDWTRYRLSRLIKIVFVRGAVRRRGGRDPGHLADPGDLRRARAALPGPAADPAAAVRVLLHRVPVHRAVLAALPRRRRHLLPGRHHHPLLRRLGPGPRGRSGSRRTSSSWRTRTRSRTRAATCRPACCCGGRPAPARR